MSPQPMSRRAGSVSVTTSFCDQAQSSAQPNGDAPPAAAPHELGAGTPRVAGIGARIRKGDPDRSSGRLPRAGDPVNLVASKGHS
jgi:hypothetical protein